MTRPGDSNVLRERVDRAHIACPPSNATRDNIKVTLTLL